MLAVHSKRSAEIDEAVADRGFDTYQARQVAARAGVRHLVSAFGTVGHGGPRLPNQRPYLTAD